MSHYLMTGTSSGLGKYTAELLARAGHRITILTTGNVDFVRGLHPKAEEVMEFIGDEEFLIDKLVERARVDQFGGIIHCGGAVHIAPLRATTSYAYRKVMQAADQAFLLLRAAGRSGMMTLDSSIVLLSSVAAARGAPGMVAYSAAKGAIEAMARSAAVELAPRSIRVNCVAPGAFRSPMHSLVVNQMPRESREAYEAKHPLGISDTADVFDTIAFLLSGSSRKITGTVVTVDGGFLA